MVEKQAYYREARMPRELALRYFRAFGDARRVLDVGCGTGALGLYCPSDDIEIDGVDHDVAALARASAYERVAHVDLESSALPYDDETFDAVLAKDILEHLHEPRRLVCEMRRVLKPGGVLVVSVVMAKPRAVWADYTHVRGFTKRSARMLLEDAGFQVEAIWRMGGVPLSNRLHVIWLVPMVLRLPLLGWLWASSWELKARR